MTENEKIKLVKLGDMEGCIFNDLVQIQISPDWIEEITNMFKEKALNNKDYASQGFNREKADFFSEAFNVWKRERNEIDNVRGK
jgi:hypothetical protein